MAKKLKTRDQVQVWVRLPKALYQAARIRAIKEDTTFASLMERALAAVVKPATK
jgi:hypothetical protein